MSSAAADGAPDMGLKARVKLVALKTVLPQRPIMIAENRRSSTSRLI